MHVKILGPGCKNCETLETRTRQALDQLGLRAEVEKVTDYAAIAGYGVMKTPGLVVDDKLLVFEAGKQIKTLSPDKETLDKIYADLKKHSGQRRRDSRQSPAGDVIGAAPEE